MRSFRILRTPLSQSLKASSVVLFSGGIDSTTTAAIALRDGFVPILLTFDYGQRHLIEIEKSKLVARQFTGLAHIIFRIDLTQIGGSALTSGVPVPKFRSMDNTIPATYVPGRNIIFLALAAAMGEVSSSYDLFYGANVLDYSGYPDCRPEFIEALENAVNLGTRAGSEGKRFKIHAPLLSMTKAEIIRNGMRLGVDFRHTHSCYDPQQDGKPCGGCDSCVIRKKGFLEAGYEDPAEI